MLTNFGSETVDLHFPKNARSGGRKSLFSNNLRFWWCLKTVFPKPLLDKDLRLFSESAVCSSVPVDILYVLAAATVPTGARRRHIQGRQTNATRSRKRYSQPPLRPRAKTPTHLWVCVTTNCDGASIRLAQSTNAASLVLLYSYIASTGMGNCSIYWYCK